MNNVSSAQVDEFLFNASAREIQQFIHLYASSLYVIWQERAKIAVSIRLAEDEAKSAELLISHTAKLTQQTDTLIQESVKLAKLTKVLIWLTVSLGLCAIIQIALMLIDLFNKHATAT